MKAKKLITSFATIGALGLCSCNKPTPISVPIIDFPETYNVQINTVSEDAYSPKPDRTDVYVYPINTVISFDTIEFNSNLYHNPYTLQHSATPPDTIQVSRQSKSHTLLLAEGQYQALIRYCAFYWYDDTCAYRYSIRFLDIPFDTIINDTLYKTDWEKFKY